MQAQEWSVPEQAKNIENPYKLIKQNINKGKKIYKANCKSCHGDMGKNNMIYLNPLPIDLGSQKLFEQSDGEIFYKINIGRDAMPTFEKTLTAEGRWMLITYIRSLDKKFAHKISRIKPDNPKVTRAFLKIIDENRDKKTITAHLTGITSKGKIVNLKNIELSAFVKRSFGQLNIVGENSITDEHGKLLIQFPNDLPGDKNGNLDITIKVSDEDLYGNLEMRLISKLGIPKNTKNPLSERVMWGTSKNAPVWIIALYASVVACIWAIIIIVLIKTPKIKKLAKVEE